MPDSVREESDPWIHRTSFLHAWTRMQRQLYRLCMRRLGGNPEDAEEALGRLAIRALEDDAARAGAVVNYPAWLTRSALNLCMDIHREKAIRQRMTDRLCRHNLVHASPWTSHPEAESLHRELAERLLCAIEGLPPRLREPCRLRFLEEMPYETIAASLGLTNETVRKRIQEARGILQGMAAVDPDGGTIKAGRRAHSGKMRARVQPRSSVSALHGARDAKHSE